MRTFLIDLENVKNQGMIGVEQLSGEDRVFIFYSESANSLSIPTIQAMNNSKAEIEYVKLQRSGRNAMDFQIVALLGFLIGSEKNGNFCIVSQDNGYVAPVEFFMDHPADQLSVNVLLSSSIIKAVRKWNSTTPANAAEEAPEAQPQPEEAEVVVVVEEEAEPKKTADLHKLKNVRKTRRPNRTQPKEAVSKAEPADKIVSEKKEPATAPAVNELKPEIAQPVKEVKEQEPVKQAAEETAAEAVKEPKAEEKKPGKRRGRPRKEKAPETDTKKAEGQTEKKSEPKPVKKKPPLQSVDVPQDLQDRIHAILNGHTDESQIKHEKVIAQALLTTKAKNEFYQFFRRALGVQAGGDLYRAVRGDYEKLKAASAVSRRSEEAE